ncbi:hypothetical protein PR048_008658, partial [Dryococelus australis]
MNLKKLTTRFDKTKTVKGTHISCKLEKIESGFVTVIYNFWWHACILAKNHDSNEIKEVSYILENLQHLFTIHSQASSHCENWQPSEKKLNQKQQQEEHTHT